MDLNFWQWDDQKKKITPEEAIKYLTEHCMHGDYEGAHGDADKILCALLRYYGQDEVVEAYDKVGKWYA